MEGTSAVGTERAAASASRSTAGGRNETEDAVESTALAAGAIAFVVGALVAVLLFWGRDLPIGGDGSLGEAAAVGGGITAAVAFVVGRLLVRRSETDPAAQPRLPSRLASPGARLHWFDVAALALAHAVIALLAWTGLADLLERSFLGAVVFTFPAIVLLATSMALTAYAAFLSAVRMTPPLLSLVLAVFLVVGVLAAMLSSSDPLWWQKNLSALGITGDVSSLAFNLTLVIAGVIVTIVARYATAGLPESTPRERRGKRLVRTLLVVIGVFLACVGIFNVDDFFALHNTVASGMAVAYAVIVIGLPSFVPSMPRAFVWLGWLYVAIIALLGVLFAVGYYNLTAVELVAFLLIFSWLIVFLRFAGTNEGATDAAASATPSRVA